MDSTLYSTALYEEWIIKTAGESKYMKKRAKSLRILERITRSGIVCTEIN